MTCNNSLYGIIYWVTLYACLTASSKYRFASQTSLAFSSLTNFSKLNILWILHWYFQSSSHTTPYFWRCMTRHFLKFSVIHINTYHRWSGRFCCLPFSMCHQTQTTDDVCEHHLPAVLKGTCFQACCPSHYKPNWVLPIFRSFDPTTITTAKILSGSILHL